MMSKAVSMEIEVKQVFVDKPRIPAAYSEALLYCVLPPCTHSGRQALAFQLASGEVQRFSITAKDADTLSRLLTNYFGDIVKAGIQSRGSELIPSAPMSMPSDAGQI